MNADPATLRETGSALRGLADQFCTEADRVDSAARGLHYEGPAGDRFHEVVTTSHAGVCTEAQSLLQLAARLEAAALQVEAEQRAALARQAGFQ